MGNDVAEILETLPPPCAIKVHRLMCTELLKLAECIAKIFPELEAARPRSSSGIEAFCSLINAFEKVKLLIEYCSESSKLYLAITGYKVLLRCRKAKTSLDQSLTQIQHMVPEMLASKLSHIVSDLRVVTFKVHPVEEDAGKLLRTLLQQHSSATDLSEESAIQSFRVIAFRLHVTSHKDILIEKRSIKRLLDKVGDGAPEKKDILMFFLLLLKKYEKSIGRDKTENACLEHENSYSSASSCNQSIEVVSGSKYGLNGAQIDVFGIPKPPEEFLCPLSLRLLYDPVIIDSGKTFERMWIKKWFDEGNDTCPKTKRKLFHLHLTPNTTIKNLLSKWCMEYGVTIPDPSMQSETDHLLETCSSSVSSLSSSMYNLGLSVDFSNTSLRSIDSSETSVSPTVTIRYKTESTLMKTDSESTLMKTDGDFHGLLTNSYNDMEDVEYLRKLNALPWEVQCKVIEDVHNFLKDDSQAVKFSPDRHFEALSEFLKEALKLNDLKAQRAGVILLLTFVKRCRNGGQYLHDGAYGLLASFIKTEVIEEAVLILEALSHHPHCRSKIAASGALTSILQMLEIQRRELQEPAVRILHNLSMDNNIHSYILSAEFVPKLVPYFGDAFLSRYCIAILKNLCDYENVRISVVETDGCIASVANQLKADSRENQENAVLVLLSLCSQHEEYCQMIINGGVGVISSLLSISRNGNDKAKACAMELLRIFHSITFIDDEQQCSLADHHISTDSINYSKEQKIPSVPPRYFRKISMFSKSVLKKIR